MQIALAHTLPPFHISASEKINKNKQALKAAKPFPWVDGRRCMDCTVDGTHAGPWLARTQLIVISPAIQHVVGDLKGVVFWPGLLRSEAPRGTRPELVMGFVICSASRYAVSIPYSERQNVNIPPPLYFGHIHLLAPQTNGVALRDAAMPRGSSPVWSGTADNSTSEIPFYV